MTSFLRHRVATERRNTPSPATLGLLVVAAASTSGCGAVVMGGLMAGGTVISGGACVAGGGPGYRVGTTEVVLATCGDLEIDTCPVTGADPASFRSLRKKGGRWWAVDSKRVYAGCRQLEGADAADFEPPRPIRHAGKESRYSVAGSYVLSGSGLLTGADPDSFVILNERWVRDDEHVWFQGFPHPAHAQSLRILDTEAGFLAADDRAVYSGTNEVPGLDPRTVQILRVAGDRATWLRDRERVARGIEIVPGADAETFEFLSHDWARDRSRVYSPKGIPIEADPTTVRPLSPTVIVDERGVADAQGRRWEDADPATLRHVEGPFWKDANDLWAGGEPLGTGPVAVERLSKWSDVWRMGSAVAWCLPRGCCRVLEGVRAQPTTLKDLPWIIDDAGVWYGGRRVVGADPKTFEKLSPPWGRDRNRAYWADVAIPEIDHGSLSVGYGSIWHAGPDFWIDSGGETSILCVEGEELCYQRPRNACAELPTRVAPPE